MIDLWWTTTWSEDIMGASVRVARSMAMNASVMREISYQRLSGSICESGFLCVCVLCFCWKLKAQKDTSVPLVLVSERLTLWFKGYANVS